MDNPPLTLNVNTISPPSLIPTYIPTPNVLPSQARELPTPPNGFTFSPTPNYPSPFGVVPLGSTLSLDLALKNTSMAETDVLGVRMMVEVQGPSGRYRLGEVVHSDEAKEARQGLDSAASGSISADTSSESPAPTPEASAADKVAPLPALRYGDSLSIQVDSEMKDLGLNVVIVSVAWETLDGRRTMQRFLKFNVNPPLAIKTRIQTPTHPNTALSREKREEVYLEVLMQNVSGEGMVLSRVFLEAVQGLKSRSVSVTPKSKEDATAQTDVVSVNPDDTLLPNDTRQYLFVLSPDLATPPSIESTPRSSFSPSYAAGTILPLGRLDVTWVSGVYHVPGRLQTSTLNRRVPIPPPTGSKPATGSQPLGRTLSAQSASHPSPLNTPAKDRSSLIAPSPLRGTLKADEPELWEFDLALDGSREVEVEQRFKLAFKLGVRSTLVIPSQLGSASAQGDEDDDDDAPLSRRASRLQEHELPPPPTPKIAIQYLTPLPLAAPTVPTTNAAGPQVAVLPPSRSSTPLSPPPTSAQGSRPFSPLGPHVTAQGRGTTSRPMTPLSTQLRQAQSQGLGANSSLPSAPGSPASVANATLPSVQATEDDYPNAVFPPPPVLTAAADSKNGGGQVVHIGHSMVLPSPVALSKVLENSGPTYPDQPTPVSGATRWESVYAFELDFVAFDEGLAGLGGIRVLLMDEDEEGGKVVREWESLGDLIVWG